MCFKNRGKTQESEIDVRNDSYGIEISKGENKLFFTRLYGGIKNFQDSKNYQGPEIVAVSVPNI